MSYTRRLVESCTVVSPAAAREVATKYVRRRAADADLILDMLGLVEEDPR